jgi:hypothetical protein
MAEAAEKGDRPRSNRRRGPRRPGGRGGGGSRRRSEEGGDHDGEKREHPPSVPVPPEFVGKKKSGKIQDIVKRGRGQFGFILIGDGPRSETPRIYFNFKDFIETKFPPRRGYLVDFKVSEDEEKRICATEVKLTEEGLKEAEEREVAFQQRLIAEGKTPKERVEPRTINLKVTCHGKSGEKTISTKVNQMIGKIKHTAITEFECPVEYSVFCHITPENPEGVLLTKKILSEMNDGDLIHLRPAPEKA